MFFVAVLCFGECQMISLFSYPELFGVAVTAPPYPSKGETNL
jgi:hypothetical protein